MNTHRNLPPSERVVLAVIGGALGAFAGALIGSVAGSFSMWFSWGGSVTPDPDAAVWLALQLGLAGFVIGAFVGAAVVRGTRGGR